MDSNGISETLIKAKVSLSRAEDKKPSHEDLDYEDLMMISGVYAFISIAESLDSLSKRNFKI